MVLTLIIDLKSTYKTKLPFSLKETTSKMFKILEIQNFVNYLILIDPLTVMILLVQIIILSLYFKPLLFLNNPVVSLPLCIFPANFKL